MKDLLQLVYEYRRLSARAEAYAGSLKPRAETRLAALEKLFGQEPGCEETTPPRRHARCELSVPATIKIDGNVQPVQLINMGGGGVCVSPAPKLKNGQTALLRIVASDTRRVFQYQVKCGWTCRSEIASQMGLPFVGPPVEVSGSSQRPGSAY